MKKNEQKKLELQVRKIRTNVRGGQVATSREGC